MRAPFYSRLLIDLIVLIDRLVNCSYLDRKILVASDNEGDLHFLIDDEGLCIALGAYYLESHLLFCIISQ